MNAKAGALLRPLETFSKACNGSLDGERTEQCMTSPLQPENIDLPLPQELTEARQAFDAALAEHRNELLHSLYKRLGDREAAADLAQETLFRMMKYRDADDIEDHRSLLFRIAHNLVLEYHRVRHRHHAFAHVSLDETGPLTSQAPAVEATVDARQAIQTLLTRTVAGLPPKCRHVFMLSRFDGLSYPQIAERMGISVKMVEKHITKALLVCRAAVGDRDF